MTDYTDLIAALRGRGLINPSALGSHPGLCDEAADTIERLQEERDRAVQQLKKIGGCMSCKHFWVPNTCEPCRSCDHTRSSATYPCRWEWRNAEE